MQVSQRVCESDSEFIEVSFNIIAHKGDNERFLAHFVYNIKDVNEIGEIEI